MAVDISRNLSDLFAGKKRIRFVPTLVLTLLVTALVAVPLIVRSVDARNNPVETPTIVAPGDPQQIVVDTGSDDSRPLDLATVAGQVRISLQDDQANAVSFNLFAAGSDVAIVESRDLEGPEFDLVVSESGEGSLFDTTRLQDGLYELFITVQVEQESQRTAVSFEVQNS